MHIPFLSIGNDGRDEFIEKGFLRAAVISRNYDTYVTLSDALKRAGRLEASLDLDLLTDFLSWGFSGDDDYFIDQLLDGILPTSAEHANPSSLLYLYITQQQDQSSPYVVQRLLTSGHGSFCHPPYSMEYFLGPELLRIATGSLKIKTLKRSRRCYI
jgi:hypothetical protein